MSSLYPPQFLVLPLHVQHRLPPALQSVDLEVTLVVHSLLSMLASLFTIHISYALPLSLFGLAAISSSLISTLLPHFLFFWILSIPLDLIWLIYRADQARLLVIAMMGANMCFKVISASQAARILQSQGALPDVGTGGFGGLGSNQGWLGAETGGNTGPFGLPGSWSGQGQAGGRSQAPYSDVAQAAPNYSSTGGYRSVYDEDQPELESDAPQVRIDGLANTLSGGGARSPGVKGAKGGDYQTIE